MSKTYALSDAAKSVITSAFEAGPEDARAVRSNGLEQDLRVLARELAMAIATRTPPGRQQALALTNLEQSLHWALAADRAAPP